MITVIFRKVGDIRYVNGFILDDFSTRVWMRFTSTLRPRAPYEIFIPLKPFKDTHATHDGAPRTPKPHDHAATPPRTSSRPRKDTPPRLPHTRHALRQRPNGTHAEHAGGASSDHSNEARAQCSPAEAQLTPSARYQARRQAAHATERTAQRPRPQAAKTGRGNAPSPTRALAPHV